VETGFKVLNQVTFMVYLRERDIGHRIIVSEYRMALAYPIWSWLGPVNLPYQDI